jgi:folylpolyglutamate synthase/dihydropteroate synthase
VAPFVGLPPKATKAATEASVRIRAKVAKRSVYKALSRFEQLYAQMLADALVSRRIKDELQDSQKEYADLEQDLALARRVAVIEDEIEDDLAAAENSQKTRRNLLIFGSVLAALGMVATAHHYVKVRVTSA